MDGAPSIGWYAAAAVMAALAAVAAVLGLAHLARPAGYDQRVTQAADLVDRARALSERPIEASPHPAHSVCPRVSPASLEAIRASLAYVTARAGLASPVIAAAPLGDAHPGAITPVRVSVNVTGSYGAAMDFLGRLEAVQPEVFVDSLDLKPTPSTVELKLTGKAYCWTVAH